MSGLSSACKARSRRIAKPCTQGRAARKGIFTHKPSCGPRVRNTSKVRPRPSWIGNMWDPYSAQLHWQERPNSICKSCGGYKCVQFICFGSTLQDGKDIQCSSESEGVSGIRNTRRKFRILVWFNFPFHPYNKGWQVQIACKQLERKWLLICTQRGAMVRKMDPWKGFGSVAKYVKSPEVVLWGEMPLEVTSLWSVWMTAA